MTVKATDFTLASGLQVNFAFDDFFAILDVIVQT